MRFGSADVLTAEHLGRRVTVRHRLPDGRSTDVVGILESLDDDVVVVRDRTDTPVRIARGAIVATRVIRPPISGRRSRDAGLG